MIGAGIGCISLVALKIHAESRRNLFCSDKRERRGNQALPRILSATAAPERVLPLFIRKILHHWEDRSLRPPLTNQVEGLGIEFDGEGSLPFF